MTSEEREMECVKQRDEMEQEQFKEDVHAIFVDLILLAFLAIIYWVLQ